MKAILQSEKLLLLVCALAAAGYLADASLGVHGRLASLLETAVLIAAILAASLSVARHAERIAQKLGDPYGSMILTLSAVLVEVIVLAIVSARAGSPTLVRDSIYSAVMLDINGILGVAALIGGFKHGEQSYNDDSARTYSVMILTAVTVSMILPEFVPDPSWRAYSCFTIAAMLLLYGVFLRMQTGPHSYFFSYSYPDKKTRRPLPASGYPNRRQSVAVMAIGIIAVGALAELMSHSLNRSLDGIEVPHGLVALVVAGISAAPEMLTALRAALADRMQSVVNIALGASLSTVILTVPAMEAMSLLSGQRIDMAMTPLQTLMMLATLLVAAINLNDGQTNAIEGMTHFILFGAFLMLLSLGL
ncbi:Sodium-potassium/proton antiporter ChaA [Achromobacter insolitus]|uniref:Sodium-potassium/proton antiporter ChaA n=1 Tax=Achromobacter insolitus TaxID=217204 RepID=A0A6S7EUZ0_9BURK|nr:MULTISPECIES: calcium:proton antiporter [Achromobacter]AVG39144.1 calcium:proton antiporter [Achromobacter insolitus]MCP1403565.1 Ca2+:H+ antiporter [Achromobacter insolitus]MEB3096778.1 calcium:proton antiporter [Achromobacter sp. D10]NGT15127.1 calcium:proton antiporter [Achromobacter insolitus]CAB3929132.1 Sodium-potassium/proton antiporter ChaA [Achromobacter insolitus]